ncbi:dishevelled binding antagonist of beta catenin 2 [Phyllostomus discolor]|uniref:Dishevelled binding antagonist of beta catenin 2 n=1 Tax=Phyllostomus discolor TaxID=89673 RepID=A0A834AL96_9CHIR|nr:dishevelled binding antagonist of beta catenin 2 [Phyllostomus discolor]
MWSPGGRPGPAGWDRRRVGARLRAALAGLQELQGLRARQQALVRGALAEQPPPAPAARRAPRAQELRLEAALAALQDQLNRLRRQDVGLKTQLDRLDQQISELQLDVRRTSAEGDSDSRPSSGFYELSDGGSCSLSTSCTSVCSDRLSSSLGTLLPAAPTARTSAGACRPWSADETSVWGSPLTVWGRPGPEGGAGQPLQGPARPRPVSTGDLDRVLPATAGFPEASADARPLSLLCHGLGLPPHALDPKYQRDLVSRGGGEVYPFPSPLHAVALQSPLFALTKETPQGDSHLPPPSASPPGPSGPGSVRTGPVPAAGSAQAYIDKLLGLRGQRDPLRGGVGEQGPPGREVSPSQRAKSGGCPERPACSPRRVDTGAGAQRRETGRGSLEQRGPAPHVGPPHPGGLSDNGHKPSGSRVRVGAALGPPQLGGGPPSSCSWAQQATPEDWRGKARPPTKAPRPCIHPPSVASGAVLMGLKVGPRAGQPVTKAVRMGRGACERAPGSGRQPPPWGALPAPQRPPAWGAWLRGRPTQAREAPGRSCSESSLYPVSFLVPLLVASRGGHGASAQALFPLEAGPPVAAGGEARRRQRRWRSSVEIAAGARLAGAQGPGAGPPRWAPRRGAGPRPGCSRARPQPPRREARAGSVSGGSEHSAECASLFHSTVAETSGDEASDHTASCFGDQESGGSDAEDSAQGAGGRPPQPPRAPACPRPPLPPAPRLRRIKASRALKKRIRRFQPAALKVMTLV